MVCCARADIAIYNELTQERTAHFIEGLVLNRSVRNIRVVRATFHYVSEGEILRKTPPEKCLKSAYTRFAKRILNQFDLYAEFLKKGGNPKIKEYNLNEDWPWVLENLPEYYSLELDLYPTHPLWIGSMWKNSKTCEEALTKLRELKDAYR